MTEGVKMTIYELTEEERAVMKKLIDNGLVVTVGEHARVKQDLKAMEGFADLWYFAMDRAPGAFERIVTTCAPSSWMHKIAAIKRGEHA